MRQAIRISTAIAVVLASGTLSAHDLRGVLRQELNDSVSPQLQAAAARADVETRSVLSSPRLWPVPRKMSVCLIGDSAALRKRVADAARSTWRLADLTEGRLDFDKSFDMLPDCPAQPTRNENTRIGFTTHDGHWSYVGAEPQGERHAYISTYDKTSLMGERS